MARPVIVPWASDYLLESTVDSLGDPVSAENKTIPDLGVQQFGTLYHQPLASNHLNYVLNGLCEGMNQLFVASKEFEVYVLADGETYLIEKATMGKTIMFAGAVNDSMTLSFGVSEPNIPIGAEIDFMVGNSSTLYQLDDGTVNVIDDESVEEEDDHYFPRNYTMRYKKTAVNEWRRFPLNDPRNATMQFDQSHIADTSFTLGALEWGKVHWTPAQITISNTASDHWPRNARVAIRALANASGAGFVAGAGVTIEGNALLSSLATGYVEIQKQGQSDTWMVVSKYED